MKKALITGALGQDGTYLQKYLLSQGYFVYSMVRRQLFQGQVQNVEYIYGDLRDEQSLDVAIRKSWPDEIFNLGGQVFVPTSWDYAAETFDINTSGLARILKIVEKTKRDTKVYQASSSEMFGNYSGRCNEETPLRPMSPYGVSKMAAHNLCRLYRERGLFVVSGMLFNHESPIRGSEMLTRKVARHVAGWVAGDKSVLKLGNLESRRDWGFAGDYVVAMVKMLQQPAADDYVIGTGVSHSVNEFLLEACKCAGVDRRIQLVHTMEDERLKRTQEIHNLVADTTKAQSVLGWKPEVDFKGLVRMMVTEEIKHFEQTQNKAMSV